MSSAKSLDSRRSEISVMVGNCEAYLISPKRIRKDNSQNIPLTRTKEAEDFAQLCHSLALVPRPEWTAPEGVKS